MRVLFLGQRGIPAHSPAAQRERRVEALAQALAAAGHDVTVTGSRPYTTRTLCSYNGVRLKNLFSLNPEIPGGWIHAFLETARLLRGNYDIVHLHGWRLAVLAPLAVLLAPAATFVWTVDWIPVAPRGLMRLVARAAAGAVDAVTTPSRQLQYRLRSELGILSEYVSNGYSVPVLAELPVRRWGLRAGQYCITTANDPRAVLWAAAAMRLSKSRKKLVVMSTATGRLKRLSRRLPFLRFVGPQTGRSRLSLLRQAAAVLVMGPTVQTDELLLTMDSGRAIIATTEPYHEEVLGVSARFVQADDAAGMAAALGAVLRNHQVRSAWGRKARRRARMHFTWQRIVPEYLELYSRPRSQAVPVDSARQPGGAAQPAFARANAGR